MIRSMFFLGGGGGGGRGRLLKSLIFKAQAYTTSISLDRARECLLHVLRLV